MRRVYAEYYEEGKESQSPNVSHSWRGFQVVVCHAAASFEGEYEDFGLLENSAMHFISTR